MSFPKSIVWEFKQKMIKKAKRYGLRENFGAKELEVFRQKHGCNDAYYELVKWCGGLDIDQLEKG